MMKHPAKIITISFIMVALGFVIRIFGFMLGDNVALGMEAVHLIVDIAITLFILITLRIISSNFTKKFSYGLFKLEDLISLGLSVLVAITGIELFLSGYSVQSSSNLESGIFQAVSTIPIAIAAGLKIKAGKEIRSPSLQADGKHTYTDFYEGAGVSAGLILAGIFHSDYFFLAAIVIAFIALLLTAYSIGKESILSLLDLPKDRSLNKKITEIASDVHGIREVKEIRLRWAGPVIFVEIVVDMDPRITIDEAHPITEILEEKIKENIDGVYSVTVHVEPIRRERFKILVPVKGKDEKAELDEKLAKSTYFAIVEVDGNKKVNFVENPFREKGELAGLDFKEFLMKMGITDIICENVGEITFGLMLAYGIYCWHSGPGTLDEIISKFMNGKLEKLKEPTKPSK